MPLAHVSWALADNALRPACDAFFLDVFGAETAFEMLITPETEKYGFDREERLMMVSDTMLIPIAPAGRGAEPGNPLGDMLRRSAAPMRWLGVALRVADLKAAAAWFAARGFAVRQDRGMEESYFIIARHEALGMRIEVLGQDLPGDPRNDPAWRPDKWREEHPLGIEGLQAIGVSTPSLDDARALFAGRLEWPELSARPLAHPQARCAAFAIGDTMLEALEGAPGSDVAGHAANTKGIYHLVYKVADAQAAADYLRWRNLPLIGEPSDRIAIAPEHAQGRLIWFTDKLPQGYPPVGSRLGEPGVFPQV
ncbi:glyoxalase [Novosphingobium sp. PC22D]|nr:glyoxalase [Novosphingobium sp. PC22D]